MGPGHGCVRGEPIPAVPDHRLRRHGQDGWRNRTGEHGHTVTREQALIAHTRSNAYLFFRENDLGSIQGKEAGKQYPVVTDRDYLTVPADQIKDLHSVMTIVGGRVVYDAATDQTGTR